jgi:hypothetical protein
MTHPMLLDDAKTDDDETIAKKAIFRAGFAAGQSRKRMKLPLNTPEDITFYRGWHEGRLRRKEGKEQGNGDS